MISKIHVNIGFNNAFMLIAIIRDIEQTKNIQATVYLDLYRKEHELQKVVNLTVR